MRKKSLLLSFLASCTLLPISAQEIVLDFSNPTNLSQFSFSPLSLTELQSAKYFNENKGEDKDRCYKSGTNHVLIISDETISKDGISFHLENAGKFKDYPRFFFGLIGDTYPASPTASDFYCDLRWYKKETLTISAPEGKKIDKIVLNATSGEYKPRANGNTIVTTEGGTQTFSDDKTLNTWVANVGSEITSVTYRAEDDSPTQMAYSITVTLSDKGGSAVTEIDADNNAPVEYYDLTGNRYNGDTLAPGLYIRKAGNKVTKIFVK